MWGCKLSGNKIKGLSPVPSGNSLVFLSLNSKVGILSLTCENKTLPLVKPLVGVPIFVRREGVCPLRPNTDCPLPTIGDWFSRLW